MGLFDFIKTKANGSLGNSEVLSTQTNLPLLDSTTSNDDSKMDAKATDSPEIPEHIFVEYEKPKQQARMEPSEAQQEVCDIRMLYSFLERNLDKKGYEDALINPDTSYMEEQVFFIRNEFGLLVSKIKTYYGAYLRSIDFHIETRRRSGMIETVDELLTHKETVEEEIRVVTAIESDATEGKGLSQNPILTYRKGFRNGFAAITYNTILNRKN